MLSPVEPWALCGETVMTFTALGMFSTLHYEDFYFYLIFLSSAQ